MELRDGVVRVQIAPFQATEMLCFEELPCLAGAGRNFKVLRGARGRDWVRRARFG
jgi:hypothetical protein